LKAKAVIPPTQFVLLGLLALAIPLSGWGALYPRNTWLQLGPCVLLLLVALPLLHRFPLSIAGLRNIVLFLLLHVIAARWSYSFVPYDAWIRWLIGWSPDEAFGFGRNMFDRLVHLCFGLLAIRPVREIAARHFGLSPRASLYVAPEFVLAFSAVYEIFEWQLAVAMDPADAEAYNGQQGDIFDAQKDMTLAAIGALIATCLQWLQDKRFVTIGGR
jgi:putative membrane protein